MAKVLIWMYFDRSYVQPVRIYLEKDFAQAQLDLHMLKENTTDRVWKLIDVEIYLNPLKQHS